MWWFTPQMPTKAAAELIPDWSQTDPRSFWVSHVGPATRGLVSSGTAFSDREQGVESAVEQLEPGLARRCDAGTTEGSPLPLQQPGILFVCFFVLNLKQWALGSIFKMLLETCTSMEHLSPSLYCAPVSIFLLRSVLWGIAGAASASTHVGNPGWVFSVCLQPGSAQLCWG